MKLLSGLFKKKETMGENKTKAINLNLETMMTSQFAALYIKENNKRYKEKYLSSLVDKGCSKANAEKIFAFDCEVIKKYNKDYLLSQDFVKDWFFGLIQPFFIDYPKNKDDIIKEKFFTLSELCKLTDEAEWHFWNSHERCLSDAVWNEISKWRMMGNGMKFIMSYVEMIEKETGASHKDVMIFVSLQGTILSKYKW